MIRRRSFSLSGKVCERYFKAAIYEPALSRRKHSEVRLSLLDDVQEKNSPALQEIFRIVSPSKQIPDPPQESKAVRPAKTKEFCPPVGHYNPKYEFVMSRTKCGAIFRSAYKRARERKQSESASPPANLPPPSPELNPEEPKKFRIYFSKATGRESTFNLRQLLSKNTNSARFQRIQEPARRVNCLDFGKARGRVSSECKIKTEHLDYQVSLSLIKQSPVSYYFRQGDGATFEQEPSPFLSVYEPKFRVPVLVDMGRSKGRESPAASSEFRSRLRRS